MGAPLSSAYGAVMAADQKIMRRLNHWPAPRWLQWWTIAATRCGDGWLWALYALAILISGRPGRYQAVLAEALAVFTGVALFRLIKKRVGRKRPCHLEAHCWSSLLPPDQFSFPSGHSITAFAVAVSLGSFYPALIAGLLFCAVSVAISRVVLGMHFLSDVLAGCALGASLGYLSAYLVA
jgi:undecaprenyl-diphosphatase